MYPKTCTVMMLKVADETRHLIVKSKKEAAEIAERFHISAWRTKRMRYETATEQQYNDATPEILQDIEDREAELTRGY